MLDQLRQGPSPNPQRAMDSINISGDDTDNNQSSKCFVKRDLLNEDSVCSSQT